MFTLNVCIVRYKIIMLAVSLIGSIKCNVMTGRREREEGLWWEGIYSFQRRGCAWHLLTVGIFCGVLDPLTLMCRCTMPSMPMSVSYILASTCYQT
jgi:hypothetical protein